MDNVSNNVIRIVTNNSRYIYYNPASKMEHIETLPETNDVLSPTIIPLFGILSPPAEKEKDLECHFCMGKITKEQFLVFKLPCCRHYAHTERFKTWASLSHKKSTVRCAYCRTIYPYEDVCSLWLQKYTEKLNCTACCHTKVHTECSTDLTVLLSLLTYDHSLECDSLIVTVSGYMYKNIILMNTLEQLFIACI